MTGFETTFKEEDANQPKVSGVVKLLVRSTGYKPEQSSPEIIDTKSGGKALKIYFEVVEGQHKGTIIEDFINFVNGNPQAQNIGRARLKTLALAVGYSGLEEFNTKEPADLKGKLLMGEIYTKDAEGDYPAKNLVKKYIAKQAIDNRSSSEALGGDSLPDHGKAPF